MCTENSMPPLPSEILTKIFLHLDLADRKSVRLSCKSFYDACNQISIIRQEKIVLRYVNDVIRNTLLSCQYSRLNLEMQGLSLDTLPPEIWSHCGDKIYSLSFQWNFVNHEVLKNAILCGKNLKHLELWIRSYNPLGWRMLINELIELFEELTEEKVIREELETFKLYIDFDCRDRNSRVYINSRGVWASLIKQLFEIFPHLKTLGALCYCSSVPPFYLIPSPCQAVFAFTLSDDCLISASVERLVIDIPSDGHWLKNSSVWNLRLKEIRTTLYPTKEMCKTLFEFFSQQKLLEVICLTVNGITDRLLIKNLLLHLLKACSSLRHLQYDYSTTYIIELSKNEFSFILQQRLEFLKLRFLVNDSEEIEMNIELPVNQNLHTLVINSTKLTEEYFHLRILEMNLQNLKHLDLFQITDGVLQAIIENHVNLEVLKLNYIDLCTDFGFTGLGSDADPSKPGYSIKRLKNLRCLDINCVSSRRFTELIFLEFVFPHLKHFRFSVEYENFMNFSETFVKIAENAPLLEVVIIDVLDLNSNTLLDFCCKLKKLYYVNCGRAYISELACVKLFSRCSSLRFVALPEADRIFKADPFENILSSTNYDETYMNFKWSVEFPDVEA